MKPSKEMFGTDDWLAREIARESRISAWDLDEGKDLRRRHEENCDARNEAARHHYFHEATQHTVSERDQQQGKKPGNTAKTVIGVLVALVFLAPLSPYIFFLGFFAIFGFAIFTMIKQFKQNKGE